MCYPLHLHIRCLRETGYAVAIVFWQGNHINYNQVYCLYRIGPGNQMEYHMINVFKFLSCKECYMLGCSSKTLRYYLEDYITTYKYIMPIWLVAIVDDEVKRKTIAYSKLNNLYLIKRQNIYTEHIRRLANLLLLESHLIVSLDEDLVLKHPYEYLAYFNREFKQTYLSESIVRCLLKA